MGILIETQLFPSARVFALALKYGSITIESQENYNKGSYRNRYEVVGPNGPLTLSIPLKKGKNSGKPIQIVRIAYEEAWERKHIRTLKSCYGNSPYFDEYFEKIRELFGMNFTFLFDLNIKALELTFQLLNLNIPIKLTESYDKKYKIENNGLIDLRNQFKPGKKKDGSKLFKPTYPQVFQEKHGFIEEMSILDLLFCTGPEALIHLKKGAKSLAQSKF